MTLADHTCGGAAASTVEDRDVITVENTISFLRPATSAELFCRATVLRAGKNLVFVEAEVMVEGDAGRVLVAKMSSTLAVIALKAKPAEKLANST
jgi:acyl-coenzyme A thioesterase PaaI-like protein